MLSCVPVKYLIKIITWLLGFIPSDDVDCGGQNLSDYQDAQAFDQFSYNTSNATAPLEIYQYCYKGIRLTNTVLEQLPQVKQNFPKSITDQFISRRTGEMEFLVPGIILHWYRYLAECRLQRMSFSQLNFILPGTT